MIEPCFYKSLLSFRALLILLLAVFSFPALAIPFYSAILEGKGITFAQTTSRSFYRNASDFANFWDFCQPYNCYGTGQGDVQPLLVTTDGVNFNDAGGIYAHDLNTSQNGIVDLTMDATPSSSYYTDGKYTNKFSTSSSQLATIPTNLSFGLMTQDTIAAYAYPGMLSTRSYTVSNIFDPLAAPYGYKSLAETEIYVSFYSSWVEDDGTSNHLSQTVFHETLNMPDNFLAFSLPENLNDYNVGANATYGTYSISVINKIALVATAVPEPPGILLFMIGLVPLIAFTWKKRAST